MSDKENKVPTILIYDNHGEHRMSPSLVNGDDRAEIRAGFISIEIPAGVSWSEAVDHFEKVLELLKDNISEYKNAQVQAVSGVNNDVKQLAQAVGDAEDALEIEMDRHVMGFSEPNFTDSEPAF